MRVSLLSLFAQSLSLLSFTQSLHIFWPEQVFEYQAALVKWDGKALFHFQVQQINADGTFTSLNDDPGLNVTQLQWFASVPAGQAIFFYLSDSTGSSVQSDNLVIQAFNVTNNQTSIQSSSSTTPPTSTSSSPQSASTISGNGSTPTTSLATMPTLGNGGASMSKDSSIPYIVGILCGLTAIVASVFLWRSLRAYLRRRSVARHHATSWSPKEGPRSDMAKAPSTPSFFAGSPSALLARGVSAHSKDLPPRRKEASNENLLGDRMECSSFPPHTWDSIPLELDGSITSSSYTTPLMPTIALRHDVPHVDNARASSVMLPITAASDRTPGTHSISRSTSHRTTRMTRSSDDLTLISRGYPDPSSGGSNGSLLPHEARIRRLSVPSSPNPFDDAVFALPAMTGSTLRSHSETEAGSSTTFPQDPEFGLEDEIGILSISTSNLPHSRSPVSKLPTIKTALKRTLTRAARDYPKTPTSYSPTSTTYMDASLPLPSTTPTTPERGISIFPFVNLGR